MTAGEVTRGRGCAGPRQVIACAHYHHSRVTLGNTPQTDRVADALESQATTRPYATPPVPGTIVRVLRARRYGEFPPLRLFYSVDEAAVRLLWIEEYDELEP